MKPKSTISTCIGVALVVATAASAGAQTGGPARQPVTDASMGAASFELRAKVECGRGRPDAVDYALSEAMDGAALLRDRAAGMRQGIRDAHAALVSKGGCRAYPADELARIRQNHLLRQQELASSGGEMTMNLPPGLGGKRTGRASYGTVVVGGAPQTVLCIETGPGAHAARLTIAAPSRVLVSQGERDLAEIGARARLSVPSAPAPAEIQYAMLSISALEGRMLVGNLTGFLRPGMEMFDVNFTAVPAEDPCGVKQERALR